MQGLVPRTSPGSKEAWFIKWANVKWNSDCVNELWQLFPRVVCWNVSKERNRRVFEKEKNWIVGFF